MHIAAVVAINKKLLPALAVLRDALDAKSKEFKDIIKVISSKIKIHRIKPILCFVK